MPSGVSFHVKYVSCKKDKLQDRFQEKGHFIMHLIVLLQKKSKQEVEEHGISGVLKKEHVEIPGVKFFFLVEDIPNQTGGLRIYFFENPLSKFFTLPLEIPDKTRLDP